MVDPSSGLPSKVPEYKGQFQVSPEFKKFWHSLFKGQDLSEKQMSQMTDQFIKMTWAQMSQVLNWALKEQKKRDQEEKQERGG